MPKLILKRKAEVLREFSLPEANAAFTVGSEPGNDAIVSDRLVSMTHFQIERQGQQFFVRDLRSAFGTYVNGTKIGSLQEIFDGDVIQVGEHALVFQNSSAAAPRRENTSSVGQSLNAFLSEVKEAVTGESSKAESAAAKSTPKTAAVSNAPNEDADLDNAGDDLDVAGLEEEISEVLNKAGVRREPSTASRASAPQKKSPFYLLAIHGPYFGKKYQLNFGETRIGRDSKLNDIVLRLNKKGEVDPSISRRHATIAFRDDKFYFTDKRSQSRSRVNQQQVTENDEIRLTAGDEIEIISDQQSTIFRFVKEGQLDFSAPRRAGEWWLRHRRLAFNLGAALLVVGGLIFTGRAYRQRAIITDIPARFTTQIKTFTRLNLNGNLKFDQPSRDRDLVPAPVLADLNGDDEVDILLTQAEGTLFAIDGETRKPLWETNSIILNRSSSPVAVDVNNNDMADVIALTADGHLVAIDGLFGAEIWSSPFFEKEMVGPPIAADFNGDGYCDVAVINVEGKLNVGYSKIYNMQWVDVDIGLACQAPLSTGDLDNDSDHEIIIATERGIVLIYDGVERRIITTFDFNEELNKLQGSFFADNPLRHPVGLADLNDDGKLDLIMSSETGNLLSVSLSEKSSTPASPVRSLWWANPASADENLAAFAYPFALADVDHDGGFDVVVLTNSGSLKAFRGRGTVGQQQTALWQTLPDSAEWISSPVVFDFNKDGAADVAVINDKRALKIFSGKNGQLLWQDAQTMAGPTSMPLLGDLSDDTDLDVILLASDGTIYQGITNHRVPAGSINWGHKFGAAGNTSALLNRGPAARRYTLQMFVGLAVALAAISGNIFYHQRRRRMAKK